jgi:hypothetical protein
MKTQSVAVRSVVMILSICSVVLMPLSCVAKAISDDFEDGTIGDLWVTGGRQSGSWQYLGAEQNGSLVARVWGPESGWSYGAEAWFRTSYNFNDGKDWLIDLRLQASRSAYHTDRFYLQMGNGYFPADGSGVSDHWIEQDESGRVTLWGVRMSGAGRQFYMDDGMLVEAGPSDPRPYDNPVFSGPVDWSIGVDSKTHTATLYDGPGGTGNVCASRPLDPGGPWYVRFFLSDYTSAGFPAGDNSLRLYSFSAEIMSQAVEASVNIDPDVLNLTSRGKYITCYLTLPEGYDVTNVDATTILVNGQFAPAWSMVEEEEQLLKLKLNRSELQAVLQPGLVELTVTGLLTDGTLFEGTDTIQVINPTKP